MKIYKGKSNARSEKLALRLWESKNSETRGKISLFMEIYP